MSDVPTLEFNGVRTLPLFLVYAKLTTDLPPFGKGKAQIVPPSDDDINYQLPIIDIPRGRADSADTASKALELWQTHLTKYALRAQFIDDVGAVRFAALSAQTDSLTAYLESEQSVDTTALIEAVRNVHEFAEIHADFRHLADREANREEYTRRIETIYPRFQEKQQAAFTFIQRIRTRLDAIAARDRRNVNDKKTQSQESAPQQVDFVFVTALDEERDALLRIWPGARAVVPSHDDVRFYYKGVIDAVLPDGMKCSYSAVLVPLLSMGRVSAALATADAIRRWRPRYVILVGIAGGIGSRGIELGDILISDQVVDYETQKIKEGMPPEIRWEVQIADPRLLGAARNMRIENCIADIAALRPIVGTPQKHVGSIATGDKIVAATDLLKQHGQVWSKLIGVEMEAGGVATAASQSPLKPGFFMVRAVSDLADAEKNSTSVEKWRRYACALSATIAMALVKSGPIPPK